MLLTRKDIERQMEIFGYRWYPAPDNDHGQVGHFSKRVPTDRTTADGETFFFEAPLYDWGRIVGPGHEYEPDRYSMTLRVRGRLTSHMPPFNFEAYNSPPVEFFEHMKVIERFLTVALESVTPEGIK